MAKLKKISVFTLFALLLVALAGAFDVLISSPADTFIDLDANLSSGATSSNFICTVTGGASANVSNVTRWDNTTGTWQRNQSNLTHFATGGAAQNVTFASPKNYSDGFNFMWACEVCVNASAAGSDFCQNSTWTKFSNNRTVRYEFPPNITLEVPATANRSSVSSIVTNFTLRSNFIGEGLNKNTLDCRIWDNSSGTWTRSPLGISATNNTTTVFPHQFSENNSVSWNVECAERNEQSVKAFASSNFTVHVDLTSPTVVMNAPANNSYSASRTVLLNWTGTDTNLGGCNLFHNASGSWSTNQTNYTNASGSPQLANLAFIADGNVAWAVGCNDTVGRSFVTSNFSFTIDTADSTMVNVTNYTFPNTCTKVGIAWNTSESRNGSIRYGITLDLLNANETVHTDASTTHQANLTFGKLTETLFYYNVTSCDAAGNCNRTAKSVTTPVGLCNEGGNNAGWSAFSVLNNGATLGTIANNSGASLAYWWNATGQAWVFNQQGTTANANVPVNYGNAVFLYSATNSTWFRNTSVTGNYSFNLTQGDNFFGFANHYNFWNLSQSFKNVSLGDSIPVHGAANLTNNTVFFASFNNTIHNYISHYRGFSWENSTLLSRGDVGWAWVEMFNLTWNTSAVIDNTSLLT